MRKNPLVGIFDSGIGGLTVLCECVKELPDARYIYYGDNDHVPYGSRTAEEIYSFTERALVSFLRAGVDAAVIACNTATAVAADGLRKRFPFPIVGLEPAVKPAAKRCQNVLVLATPRTAESERLHRLTESEACRFTIAAAPELAGAIERYLTLNVPFSISDYLPRGEFDGVVLGCTHYVFFKKEIAEYYGCEIFDGNAGAARRLKALLCARFGGCYRDVNATNCPEHTNICLTFKYNKMPTQGVIFVEKSQKINQKVFSEHLF